MGQMQYRAALLGAVLVAIGVGSVQAQTSAEPEALRVQAEQLFNHQKYVEALAVQRARAAGIEQAETAEGRAPSKRTAEALGTLSWYALVARANDEALAAAKRALALAPGQLWVEANRAHALLFGERVAEARELYLSHKGKRASEVSDKLWEDLVEDDFDSLRKLGLARNDFPEILRALGITQPGRNDEIAALGAEVQSLRAAGKFADALRAAEKYISLVRDRFGEERSEFAGALINRGSVKHLLGELTDAASDYQQALGIMERALGPGHENADILQLLARCYRDQKRYAEAESFYQRSIADREKALGRDHLTVALSLGEFAGLYVAQERYGEAEPLYVRILAIREDALGREHALVADTLTSLAQVYKAQGRYVEAEVTIRRALTEVPTAKWSELRYGLLGQLEDHDGKAAQA